MVHRWVVEFLLVITAFSTVFVRQTTEVNTVPHCSYGRMVGTVSLLKKCGDDTEHVGDTEESNRLCGMYLYRKVADLSL